MWMLAFIPDAFLAWIVNTILIAGIVGFTASFFFGYVVRWLPAIAPYHLLIQVISIVLLVAGVYFKGGYSVEMAWRDRVAEMEAKVAKAEAQSKETNVKLQDTLKLKNKVITETKVVIKDRIVKETITIDAKCDIPKEALSILNDAAKAPK
jgi:hypothetical protein